MKSKREYPVVTVTQRCYKRTSFGHPWIYGNEVMSADSIIDGELCDVVSEKGKYIGTGYYNSISNIRVRIISNNTNDTFDNDFYRRRLQYAYDYRKVVMGDDIKCCRLIFGEADQFPGLTIDRFENLLSVQILSLGIEKNKDIILPALLDILNKDGQEIDGIFLRNDVKIRELEGLNEGKGWYYRKDENVSPITYIVENGIKYLVDVENGQKTGFFLDQKYNRLAAAKIARGKTVLDCCTHTGSFALNCAKGGAKHVTAIDVSASALENAKKNAQMNGLDDVMSFECGDVFEVLKKRIEAHDKSADFIILDPPAFTKSRKTVGNAKNGYLELNKLGMRLLQRGGYLATASCSHFMTEELFIETLMDAAKSVNVRLRLIEIRKQAPDHPILLGVEETEYLKFCLFQVV